MSCYVTKSKNYDIDNHSYFIRRHLQASLEEENKFIFVEINGLKLQTPAHAYALLWRKLSGDKTQLSPDVALSKLALYFKTTSNNNNVRRRRRFV
jgi:Cdc6-like AAA superfamily ATPase